MEFIKKPISTIVNIESIDIVVILGGGYSSSTLTMHVDSNFVMVQGISITVICPIVNPLNFISIVI